MNIVGSASSEPSAEIPSSHSGTETATSVTNDSIFVATPRQILQKVLDGVFGKESYYIPSEDSPKTYKIVMDNIDKNIKPNDMRMDHQTRSLHYVHKYAVRDRIDFSSFEDNTCHPNVSAIQLSRLLPSSEDDLCIRQNMCILVAWSCSC